MSTYRVDKNNSTAYELRPTAHVFAAHPAIDKYALSLDNVNLFNTIPRLNIPHVKIPAHATMLQRNENPRLMRRNRASDTSSILTCGPARRPLMVAFLAAAFLAFGSAQGAPSTPVIVAPGVYVVMGLPDEIAPENLGRVANVAFVVGPRGVVVVDSGVSYRHGEEIIGAVESVTLQPIRLLILSHPSQEVVFGAAAFQNRGIPVLMHRSGAMLMASRCESCLATLKQTLGEPTMAGTRLVTPNRLITANQALDVIGRRLMLIAPESASAPGALSVWDATTRTLIAGSLVTINRVPDMRDGDGSGWTQALVALRATHCKHLIPAYGTPGSCADIDALERYFVELDRRVKELLIAGVGLAELPTRCDLPEFAEWDGYARFHVRNASRAYLRMERASFEN